MAFEHPFLLSGIQAISALHLSTVQPHRKQLLQTSAVALASSALPSFRTSMNHPTPKSIHAIFAFAGSLVYYIMASPDFLQAGRKVDRCRIPSRGDDQPHWFQTMRGLMALLLNNWDEIIKGPLSPLVVEATLYEMDQKNPPGKTNDEKLVELEALFPLSSTFNPSSDVAASHLLSNDEHKDELCMDALAGLRRVSALLHSSSKTLHIKTSIHMWAGSVSQEFVELIYEQDPRALVLLAHYCVLLKKNDNIWYLRGLGPGLLENIRLALGAEWQPWIQWALDQPIGSSRFW
ncbi:uncharacterized protein PAC_19916 [Phialocephala subalpina]|uniref:C6 finger domain protein n=1 Tax=Phialocephala subalpina TaxID=576137 RepID=A0A1L7XYJ8_9HELO|nr:uncharacterized protein PAC_19916 [Phialocephala subalpina]